MQRQGRHPGRQTGQIFQILPQLKDTGLLREPIGPFQRIVRATVNSANGLMHGMRTEAAVRDEIVLLAAAVIAGIFIAPSLLWYLAMTGVLLFVLAVELLNTAIEKLADHITPEHHPQIGIVKDYGSAAVMCALAITGLVWLAALLVRLGIA